MGKVLLNPARKLAVEAMRRIEQEGAFTDIVLSHLSEDASLSQADKSLLNEIVRGTIKWKKRLDWIVQELFQLKKKMPDRLRWLLWIALYQIDHLDRVEDFAIVHQAVEQAKILLNPYWSKVVNGMLRNYLREKDKIEFPHKDRQPVQHLAVTTSHPDWLVERWIGQFGFDATLKLCQTNNETPPLCVRINPLKSSAALFESEMREDNVAFKEGMVDGFYVIEAGSWARLKKYIESGSISVQDESAALPVLLASPRPNDVVFDLCAAPGGKCTMLAERVGDQAYILAGDVNRRRTGLIKKNIMRLGLKSVSAVTADGLHFPAKRADIVILDVPCSGFGVLRRKPDLRWRRTLKDISDLAVLQEKLINAAARLVAPGGKLIYSTCTIMPEENEERMYDFLMSHPEFRLTQHHDNEVLKQFADTSGFIKTLPHLHKTDGIFAAQCIRTR
jgi:16S rRNA (cytosine967-C5)-methyltransferase